jgi:hypothetical protein
MKLKSTNNYIYKYATGRGLQVKQDRSSIGFAWINELQEYYGVCIKGRHGSKEKTLELNGKKIRLDGYHKETRTVFEFLGDYFHGNPKNYPIKKEAYKKTMHRLLTLNQLGYNVIYVWENDYKRLGRLHSGFLAGEKDFNL